jgi:hypothetical protein
MLRAMRSGWAERSIDDPICATPGYSLDGDGSKRYLGAERVLRIYSHSINAVCAIFRLWRAHDLIPTGSPSLEAFAPEGVSWRALPPAGPGRRLHSSQSGDEDLWRAR